MDWSGGSDSKTDNVSVTEVQLRGQAGRIPAAVEDWAELKCYFAQLVLGNNLLRFMTVKVFKGFQFFN